MKLGRSRTRRRVEPFSGTAPSSPRLSLLSSWLLKLRKIRVDRSDHRRDRRCERRLRPGSLSPATRHYNSPSEVVSPPKRGGVEGGEEGQFLEGGGGFWRLSFRGGRMFDGEGDFSGDLLGPIWYRSDGDKETNNFEEMVSGIGRRESQRRSKSLPDIKVESAEREAELKTPRRRKVQRERKFRIRSNEKVLEAKNQDRILSNYSFSSRKSFEDCEFPSKSIAEMQKQEDTSDGGDTGREKQRKSLYISRREPPRRRPKRQSSRVQVRSPRAARVEVRRPRSPAEDTKKANSKPARARSRTKKGGGAGNPDSNRLERFAVVKCSRDPQRDFRESMMEMIVERRIRRSEDMEELLACYLTLNSEEYHDLIIKVFRQVWFELNQACFDW